MAKTIIISESMQKELNDILSMTQFKFKSNIKKFLAELLEDPIGAMPDMIFTHNGLDKNKLIKSLVDNKVINKKMTIDDHDADGTPHKAKMIVRYSVPKERFNDRLDALYDVLFPDVPAKINEDGGGATSCSGVDGNGFGSGEFIQPMGGVQRHPGDPKQKTKKRNTVGGDAYSVEINEAVNEYQDSLINTDDFSSLPSFAKQVAYCKEKLGAPIGNGSSRIVFRVDDNKVLKLAKNRKGRAQNEAECENCNDYYAGDMFAKVFEYDQTNFTYIIAEEARPPKSSDFQTCLGVTYQEFCRICLGSEREYSYGPKKMRLPALTQEDYDMLEENDALREWYDYITNYQPTSVYELVRKCNLGLATNRQGCPHGLKIIITDSGFNDNVQQMYYGKVNEAVTGEDADKSAALYVYNEDGDHNWFILCARRANRKGDEEGGKWNPPMGHLHKGESIKDGAIRECLEESGIDFSKYKSEIRVNDHLKWGSNCILKLGDYVSPSVTIDDFKPGKGDEENSKFIWLPLEEIDTKTWAWTCGENAKKFIPGEIDLSESKKHKTKKKSKVVKNDKGEVVPETCTCGGHIGLYICGEPVYKCAECGKYYGTMPFPKNLDEKYEHDWKEGENEEDDDYPEVEMIGDKYNYRRNDGTIMFPNELFDYCGEYRYGVGVIQKGDRWNFVDVDGNLLSPYEWFDRCYQFHDGVGRVEKNDRDAFMNKYGNYIISRWFDDSRQFKDGYGLVRINNNWKYIDLDGHIYTSKPINQKQYR